jgi:hypothetical protein
MKIFVFSLSIFLSLFCWSQKLSIKFDCTVIYAANNDFVPFAEIFFLEGADTVFSGTANEEGNIKFELLLDKRKVWRMAGQYCKFQAVTTIHKPEDSVNYHFTAHVIFMIRTFTMT